MAEQIFQVALVVQVARQYMVGGAVEPTQGTLEEFQYMVVLVVLVLLVFLVMA